MKRLIRNRLRKLYLALTILICVLFYTEFFSYHFNSLHWHQLKCQNEETCTKILLVADPQIIGNLNEVVHFLTPFSIWDSDRYLRVTYQRVFNFVQPDVVIFLGDLFDEGSISSQNDFEQYVNRLYRIFSINRNSTIKYIWLPGDNDIGGEGADIITAQKADKFNRVFLQPDNMQFNDITFYTINRLVEYIPNIVESNQLSGEGRTRVGLSHIPILQVYSRFATEVLEELQPHVLFTAHEHKSKIIHYNVVNTDNRLIEVTYPKTKNYFHFTLKRDYVYEFMVPTCSYRMGTSHMGYGYAIIENDDLEYTVLWSPTRFPTLIFYGVILIILTPLLLVQLLLKLIYLRRNKWPKLV